GDRATALNAFEAAARSYASALELWPADDDERPRLLLSYGTALVFDREAGEAELAEAARGLVELGDRELAAEAEILLGDHRWRAGQRDEAYAHLERAVELVADVTSSATKARVLSEVSRYDMLSDRAEEATNVGLEALDMATELGLVEVQAHALASIGPARIQLGDFEGIRDIERGIEIADEIGSYASTPGYHHL